MVRCISRKTAFSERIGTRSNLPRRVKRPELGVPQVVPPFADWTTKGKTKRQKNYRCALESKWILAAKLIEKRIDGANGEWIAVQAICNCVPLDLPEDQHHSWRWTFRDLMPHLRPEQSCSLLLHLEMTACAWSHVSRGTSRGCLGRIVRCNILLWDGLSHL